MELFDKKYVYLEWDDVLEDKEVFVADCLADLRRRVDNNDHHGYSECVVDSCVEFPFRVYSGITFAMAYYDPLYEYKLAYNQGKKVEVYGFVGISRAWIEVTDDWKWEENYEYRIKPEKPKTKWRPFKDIQELKQTWLVKNDAKSKGDLYELFIWVRFKNYRDASKLIVGFDKKLNKVCVAGTWFNLSELHEHCEFLNGSPCGVEE